MKQTSVDNIDEYISGFPPDVQEPLQKLRSIIRKAAPDAKEAIKYQIPTYVWNGNLIHFAAFKNHIGLYPGSKAVENFKQELAKYELSKGTIRFPLGKPLPAGLVTKIVKFNMKERSAKAKKAATVRERKHRSNG
jgi:uncharacterized protein YdhG (YjbR/CyaY superfamily)